VSSVKAQDLEFAKLLLREPIRRAEAHDSFAHYFERSRPTPSLTRLRKDKHTFYFVRFAPQQRPDITLKLREISVPLRLADITGQFKKVHKTSEAPMTPTGIIRLRK
jgi:hypothetical protein